MVNPDEKRKPHREIEDRNVLINDQDRPLRKKCCPKRGMEWRGRLCKSPKSFPCQKPFSGTPTRQPGISNKTKICSSLLEASHQSLCLRPFCFSLWCFLFPFSLKYVLWSLDIEKRRNFSVLLFYTNLTCVLMLCVFIAKLCPICDAHGL